MSQEPTDEPIPNHEVEDFTETKPQEQGLMVKQVMGWGALFGTVCADLGQSILSFIPRGIGETYDSLFKRLPVVGQFFSKKWVDDTFKMVFGVTIGQGLAADIARYVFRPLGFVLGAGFGATVGYSVSNIPTYSGQMGQFINNVAGQTVAGCLSGLLALLIGVQFQAGLAVNQLGWLEILVALGAGGLLGFMAKAMMLIAMEIITRANAAGARLNAKRAKMLGARLKTETKEQSESLIKQHAKEMIFQTNGPQLDDTIESFFSDTHIANLLDIYSSTVWSIQ